MGGDAKLDARRLHRRLLALTTMFALCSCAGRACQAEPRAAAVAAPDALPGAGEQPLQDRLAEALRAKGRAYVPRTRHHNPDGTPRYTNRLIFESSPYLLQHAHNPVNWFPWGDEAFELAARLRRPVFLSIGYSTCHWCHVMEEESFEDEAIATYLNEHYVCIKVDREERPDIDATYMDFVQALTGRGGWPMSVWLTPSREPFFGGTYFPPRAGARGAPRGLLETLRAQAERFGADPETVVTQAKDIAARMQAALAPEAAGDLPDATLLRAAAQQAAARFDPDMGGTRGAPKFPSSFPVGLLLRVARRHDDAEARRMALLTLDRMHAGGIYDHLGGGFHRYSTDARWLVPHFEKMLYDNALLARTYLEAAQLSGAPRYAAVARETLDYLLREMQAPDGTFYAATDADSLTSAGHLEEGAYFTWTPAELAEVLGAAQARIARTWFGVSDAGQLDGRSVLHTARDAASVAAELALTPEQLETNIRAIRQQLLDARAKRPPPLRDDKAVVAWNALAVSALARAAITLGEARYAEAAQRCAASLVAEQRAGRALPHVIMHGRAQGRAFADDIAALAAALLDVFELSAEPRWLTDAELAMATLERDFKDDANGGYFLSANTQEALLLRNKPDRDGPTPSVNSVAALTWLRLYGLTDKSEYRERAETTVRAFSHALASQPLALDQMLCAVDWATDSPLQIALVVGSGAGALATAAQPLRETLGRRFVPNSVLVVAAEAQLATKLSGLPWLREKRRLRGLATAYVCERGTCQLPTSDPAVFASQLDAVR